MTLSNYLSKHHQAGTAKIYLFEIGHYLEWMGEGAQKASHEEVLCYVDYLRDRYGKAATISRIIHAIKRYYCYLQEIGKRRDHPCRLLNIRDAKEDRDIQIQDLLKPEELQRLLIRKERYPSYALRNSLIMSLLVNQALLSREIVGLKVQDVNLEKGTIYIRQTSKTNGRTLPLKAEQIMLIHRYLSGFRARMVKEETAALIITGRGTAEQGEGIHYLVTTFRKKLPGKKLTPMTIRQSVIANKLKAGKDLRIVQVFAGHRQPSSTEAYRSTNLEELKVAVAKYHPLNELLPTRQVGFNQ